MGAIESLAPATGMGAMDPQAYQGADSTSFTFTHMDPQSRDGLRTPYTPEQSLAMSKAMLAVPRGGALRLPGFEDRFEVRWGTEAAWMRVATGMYQENVQNGNLRLVEVNEIDAWLEAQDKALCDTRGTAEKKPCRYWDKCYNHCPVHREIFLHPNEASQSSSSKARRLKRASATHKVELAFSELFGTPVATAYHTSILVDGEEFSFSDHGIARCTGPVSHTMAHASYQIVDYGLSPESGETMCAALLERFHPGTYDLLTKNCNSFSDLALYYLVQERLKPKYKVIERVGSYMPSIVTKLTGGEYVPNPLAADFDPNAIIPDLDRALSEGALPATGDVDDTLADMCRIGC